MQDNPHPHAAQWMLKFLGEVDIARFELPYCSPDLNPIENIWDRLGRRIRARTLPVNSLNALKTASQKEWETIPQEEIRVLIDDMLSQLQVLIRAHRGNVH